MSYTLSDIFNFFKFYNKINIYIIEIRDTIIISMSYYSKSFDLVSYEYFLRLLQKESELEEKRRKEYKEKLKLIKVKDDEEKYDKKKKFKKENKFNSSTMNRMVSS